MYINVYKLNPSAVQITIISSTFEVGKSWQVINPISDMALHEQPSHQYDTNIYIYILCYIFITLQWRIISVGAVQSIVVTCPSLSQSRPSRVNQKPGMPKSSDSTRKITGFTFSFPKSPTAAVGKVPRVEGSEAWRSSEATTPGKATSLKILKFENHWIHFFYNMATFYDIPDLKTIGSISWLHIKFYQSDSAVLGTSKMHASPHVVSKIHRQKEPPTCWPHISHLTSWLILQSGAP